MRRLTSAQPSAASAAWSSSEPSLRDHDQPEPILCHSTGPPSPVSSCSSPSRSSTVCSPMRHLADFTNWKTPMLKPWFQPRIASPKAAVDFPLPGPVCTMSSGRLRRSRVVSPSSGIVVGTPCGMSAPPALEVDGLVEAPSGAPAVAYEVGHGLQVAHRTEAEPRDRAYAVGQADEVGEELLAVERHPPDAEALGGGGEPEVLD